MDATATPKLGATARLKPNYFRLSFRCLLLRRHDLYLSRAG